MSKKIKNQYALFAGMCTYANGGAGDCKAIGNDINTLKDIYNRKIAEWLKEGKLWNVKFPDTSWGHIARLSDLTIVCHIRGGNWNEGERK